jgi:hypothetical protein
MEMGMEIDAVPEGLDDGDNAISNPQLSIRALRKK